MYKYCVSVCLLFLLSLPSFAEMSRIDDADLSEVTGQSGVYLTGEISINEEGGPLNDDYFGSCADVAKVCGARIALQTQQDGGWFVLDNIQGSIAFEGLTFQLRSISSGFGGDGALFNRDVIEIGLPETLKFSDFQYTIATSNNERPAGDASSFKQVDFMTVEIGGEVTMEGNLLVFPTP